MEPASGFNRPARRLSSVDFPAPLRPVTKPVPVGERLAKRVAALRQSGKVVYPEDIGIRRSDATRSLLAAGSVADLVEWSDGLYNPPAKFRSW